MGPVGVERSQLCELWDRGFGSFCSRDDSRVRLENSQVTIVRLEETMNRRKEKRPQ